jgi:hypothetical protein
VTERLELDGYVIEHDPVETRAVYETIARGASEDCACDSCKNFAMTRESIYPLEFRDLLERLGIDWRKEEEPCAAWPSEDTPHRARYVAYFPFRGRIVTEERVPEGYGDPARAFSFSMNNGTPYPWTLARWGEPLAFIDFYANAPWVLSKTPG